MLSHLTTPRPRPALFRFASHLRLRQRHARRCLWLFQRHTSRLDPAISPQLILLGYYHNDSSLCSVRIPAPLQTGAYEVHVLLGGQALANCPVALDVVPARWVELATSLLGSLVCGIGGARPCLLLPPTPPPSEAAIASDRGRSGVQGGARALLQPTTANHQDAAGVRVGNLLALGQDLKHLLQAMPSSTVAIEPAATLADAQAAFRKHQPRVLIFRPYYRRQARLRGRKRASRCACRGRDHEGRERQGAAAGDEDRRQRRQRRRHRRQAGTPGVVWRQATPKGSAAG